MGANMCGDFPHLFFEEQTFFANGLNLEHKVEAALSRNIESLDDHLHAQGILVHSSNPLPCGLWMGNLREKWDDMSMSCLIQLLMRRLMRKTFEKI
jgi:hypothetical protein